MKVSIWDIDYFNTKEGVNYECMKIASYHKQRGDSVNFIENQFQVNMSYDLIYVTKKDDALPSPPLKFINNPKSRVWGEGFRFFSNYELPAIILACRPDYSIYPVRMRNKFDKADAIQLFDNRGNRLPIIQDFKNVYTNKKTLVLDKAFWVSKQKDLLEALDLLKEQKNIAFLEPISLKRVLSDKVITEKFIALNFTAESRFKWKYNLKPTKENDIKIIEFLDKLNQKTASFIGDLEIPIITGSHLNKETAWGDFERALWIMYESKKRGLALKFQQLANRFETPYLHLFETLINWSETAIRSSLLEFIAVPSCIGHACTFEELYMHHDWWTDEKFWAFLPIIKEHHEWLDYFLIQWKDKKLSAAAIDWAEIERYA